MAPGCPNVEDACGARPLRARSFSECLLGFVSAPVYAARVLLLFLWPTAKPRCDPASLPSLDASVCGRWLKAAHLRLHFAGSHYRTDLIVGSKHRSLSEGSQLE